MQVARMPEYRLTLEPVLKVQLNPKMHPEDQLG